MFHFKRGLSEKADLIKYGAAVESSDISIMTSHMAHRNNSNVVERGTDCYTVKNILYLC